ncbi:cell surface protein [Deinococcus irradiatisoli]|uniref:Cell surface protein n=1 Tax=Deinococcus irradiatisoli TaxID=2202254 RepID=A0A2Z3JDX1_9DEIO|nr:IPT/TIG domain-containing protein [Deinococcus irradiatisoli]AWN23155.1 cell surface protein [Deinococcus irradiatisoli]
MRIFLLGSLLLVGTLASCAPRVGTVAGVTQTPMLIKVSSGAAAGASVTIQGRYLGGPTTGRIRLGADENGQGGYLIPAGAVTSWTDSQIVFTVPANAPAGGSWLFIEVNGRQSTGLPFSVSAQ